MAKQSKKWWALTEYQRRKDKSIKKICLLTVPSEYRRIHFEVPYKRKCKSILRKAVRDMDFEELSFPINKQDAGYTYW